MAQMMGSLTAALYGLLVVYLGGWFLGFWTGNFSLLLFMLTVATMLYWLAERFHFRPEREAAAVALQQRDFKQVKTLSESALKRWPSCFWARRFLGDAAWMQGDAATALEQFHLARALDDRDPVLAYAMGELLLSIGQRKQGRTLLLRALREDSRFHAARLRLAEDCFAAGEDVAGKLHARLLIEYDPDHEKAKSLLAAKAGATAVMTLADTARRVNESIKARQDASAQQKPAAKPAPEEDDLEVDLDEI